MNRNNYKKRYNSSYKKKGYYGKMNNGINVDIDIREKIIDYIYLIITNQ